MQDQITHGMSAIYRPSLFASFFQGGFACSTERRGDGRRLDLVVSSGHEMLAARDYAQLATQQISTVRDGVRWHLIEQQPGHYDWSSFLPMLHAAQINHTEVIWDICHFGWPEHYDIWQPSFIEGFARFSAALATLVRQEGISRPCYTPINAISWLAWAGGDMAHIAPMSSRRGKQLKRQLISASLAAMDAILQADPSARFLQPEPVVHIDGDRSEQEEEAGLQRLAQFEVWDMLSGRLHPELGGSADRLDIVGINYRPDSQWLVRGGTINNDHSHYRPFASLLREVWQRYQRPLLIAETGATHEARVDWMRYMFEQSVQAMKAGVPVEGLCLHPIADYRNWSGDKHLPFGLLGMPDVNGCRSLFEPLALEIRSQQIRLAGMLSDDYPAPDAVPA